MKKSLSLALFLLSSSSLLQAKGGLEKVLGGPEEDLHLNITRAIKKQKSRVLDGFSGSPLLPELKKQYGIQIVALENIRAHSLMSSSSSGDLSSSTEEELKLAYNKARSEIKQLKKQFAPEARLQLITSFASLPIEGAPAESVKYGVALKDTPTSALVRFQAEFHNYDYHQFIEWKNYAIYLSNAAKELNTNGHTERSIEYKKAAFRIYEEILPVGDKAIEALRNKKLQACASNARSKTTGELGVIFTTDELLESAYYDAGGLALTLGHTETALNFLLWSQCIAEQNKIDREYLPYLIACAWHDLGMVKNNAKYYQLAVTSYDEYFKSNPKGINLDNYIKAAGAALSAEQMVEAESWMRKVIDTVKVTNEANKLKLKPRFRDNAQKLASIAYNSRDYSTALYFYESIVQNEAILNQEGLNPSMQYYNAGSMAYLANEDGKARSYFSHVNRQDPLVTPMMCEGMDVWLKEIGARESGRELGEDSYSSSSSEDESEEDEEKEFKKDHQYYYAKLTSKGQLIYAEVSQVEYIEPSFSLGSYFDFAKISECEKAIKAITTIQKLLMADIQAPFNEIIDQIEELQEFLKSDDQKLSETEEKLYSSIQDKLNNSSDEDDSDEAFFIFASEALKDPVLQESKLNALVKNIASTYVLTKFMNKIIERIDESELKKEILSSYLEEVPENEKGVAAGIAKNLFKASKLAELKDEIERLIEDDQVSRDGASMLPSSLSEIQGSGHSTSSPTPVVQEDLAFKFVDLKTAGRPYATLFNPSEDPYENYWKEFLPKMGESCRAYNKFEKTDEEILAILFPGLPQGTYPDLETATKKFASLAANNRPYAKLFNPPSFSSSGQKRYEDYWKEFLPKMGDSCRAYNSFDYSDEKILAILFPGLPQGTYPDLETATKKFASLAANNRPYAKLFNPPSDLSL